MEKHTYHLSYCFTQGFLQAMFFLAAILKGKNHKKDTVYLGDNFPWQ